MLFTTVEFLLLYLPVTVVMFFWLGRRSHTLAAGWLFLASLFFYGWWDARYVLLLLASIAFNFTVGTRISNAVAQQQPVSARRWLIFGIAANLSLLGFFKYAAFTVTSANSLLDAAWPVPEITLPLGISFFTFTQIAFLADARAGLVRDYNPVHYGLFVTIFPHLIAGPILHHKQMMPQFAKPETYRFCADHLADGLGILLLGLAKKLILADRFGEFANFGFEGATQGEPLTFFAAWGAALSYTFQIYFDFSGYSDMAIGLGRMLNVRLPINFSSPYQSLSIIDFWRRWHISLSNFLRDYLYIPLGGSRHGKFRRYINLFVTMLLGGLWHGAGWTFVIWGALHGSYLIINHGFRSLKQAVLPESLLRTADRWLAPLYWLLTFLAVVVAWVFFRADNLEAALTMLRGMAGYNGAVLPTQFMRFMPILDAWVQTSGRVPYLADGRLSGFAESLFLFGLGFIIVLLGRRTIELTPRWRHGLIILCAATVVHHLIYNTRTEFLYFQF